MELCNMEHSSIFLLWTKNLRCFIFIKNIPTIFFNYHHVFIKRTGSFFGMETGRETDTF